MTSFIRTAKAALAREHERLRNRSFLEATMAASALVAMADGEVKFSELSALDDLLENVRELQVYDPHVAVDLCRDYVEAIAAERHRSLNFTFHHIADFVMVGVVVVNLVADDDA